MICLKKYKPGFGSNARRGDGDVKIVTLLHVHIIHVQYLRRKFYMKRQQVFLVDMYTKALGFVN